MNGFSGKWRLENPQWQGGMYGETIWDVCSDKEEPLTVEIDGVLYRIDYHIKSDLGSVPRSLQRWLPRWFERDRYSQSYIFHDNLYNQHGLWVAVAGGWEFCEFTRAQADEFLYKCLLIEGASKANAKMIWLGVRMGGWNPWGKKPSSDTIPAQ